jgi:hypothetical protein
VHAEEEVNTWASLLRGAVDDVDASAAMVACLISKEANRLSGQLISTSSHRITFQVTAALPYQTLSGR